TISEGRFQFETYSLSDLEHLDHPSLADQLESYIYDRSLSNDAREFVIRLASSCKVESLVPTLVNLSLDASEGVALRIDAIYALRHIAKHHPSLSRLKLLVEEPSKHQVTEMMQVIAVGTLWPNNISPQEYFAFLGSVPDTFDSTRLDT